MNMVYLSAFLTQEGYSGFQVTGMIEGFLGGLFLG